MSFLECNCKWNFAKQADASQEMGPNNAAAEYFSSTPYPSLIRESIQNSLDVVLDKSKPVRMEFDFGQLKAKSYEAFYELRKHIQGVIDLYGEKAEAEYLPMLKQFEQTYNFQDALYYIKVSDYNTQGMDYEPGNSPFHAFIRSIGLTVKNEETSGGSFGFGKSAYFLMSPIHAILVSTMTKEGKLFFEGAAQLCTHLYTDENGNKVKYQHYGYYDNQEGRQPATLPTDIPNKFRRDEVGTDIFIMGVDGDIQKRQAAYDEMIKATLRHFWLSIYTEKLVVKIGDTVIDKDSLDILMCAHFPLLLDTVRSGDEYNPRPYYEAVKNTGSSPAYIKIDGDLPLLGKVSLYVCKNKEARDGVVHMRKQCMFIYRARFYTRSYGYYAVFLCADEHGNKLLKNIEDPAHKKWEARRDPSKGRAIMDEITDFITRSIQDLFVSDTGGPLGVTGLEKYLFVPEELIASDKKNLEDNPFFGVPGDNTQDDGTSPISEINNPDPKIEDNRNEAVGKVVIETGPAGGKADPNGNQGGHKRRSGKRKRRGKGGRPGTGRVTPDPENEGEVLENIPVHYRVMAERKGADMVHSIIIKTDSDVERGKIDIVVGGEERDETIGIVSSSQGDIEGNTITNIKLLKDRNNIIELRFEDKMKHAIKLTAYEFK
jgi:hypothetical protein